MALEISATNGSQFFFWFTEASVEITPKLISVGVSARTAVRLLTSTRAPNAPVPSNDDIDGLPVVVNQRRQFASRAETIDTPRYTRALNFSSAKSKATKAVAPAGSPTGS